VLNHGVGTVSNPLADDREGHAGICQIANTSVSKCVHSIPGGELDSQLFQDRFQLPFQHAIQAQWPAAIGLTHKTGSTSAQVLADLRDYGGVDGHVTGFAVLGCAFFALNDRAANRDDTIIEVHIFNSQRKQLAGAHASASRNRKERPKLFPALVDDGCHLLWRKAPGVHFHGACRFYFAPFDKPRQHRCLSVLQGLIEVEVVDGPHDAEKVSHGLDAQLFFLPRLNQFSDNRVCDLLNWRVLQMRKDMLPPVHNPLSVSMNACRSHVAAVISTTQPPLRT